VNRDGAIWILIKKFFTVFAARARGGKNQKDAKTRHNGDDSMVGGGPS